MAAAVEARRLVFVLGRDSSVVGAGGGSADGTGADRSEEAARRQDRSMGGSLTISSPVDAHTPGVITLALQALDTGHDNPAFVALELEYDDEAMEDDDDDEDEDEDGDAGAVAGKRMPPGIQHPTASAVATGTGARVPQGAGAGTGGQQVPLPPPGPAREQREADDSVAEQARPWRTPAEEQARAEERAAPGEVPQPPPRGRRKVVSVYELDLGINSVRRRWRGPAPPGASSLLTVPAGRGGPGGWLVLGEDVLMYQSENSEPIAVRVPRRHDTPDDRRVLAVSGATFQRKSVMFSLVQTEQGDLFRVLLHPREQPGAGEGGLQGGKWAGGPGAVQVRYLDTVPPVCAPLQITRAAQLFAPCEGQDAMLFRFTNLGDPKEGDGWEVVEAVGKPGDLAEGENGGEGEE